MAETRRKFDQDFKEGALRLVRETAIRPGTAAESHRRANRDKPDK